MATVLMQRLGCAGMVALCLLWTPPSAYGAQGGTARTMPGVNRARPDRPAHQRPHRRAMAPKAGIVVSRMHKDSEAPQVALAAQRLAERRLEEAQAALTGCKGPGAALIRARIAVLVPDGPAATAALDSIDEAALTPLVHLQRGILALAQSKPRQAVEFLAPLVAAHSLQRQQAALPLARALLATDPPRLLACLQDLLQLFAQGAGGTGADADSRSMLMELGARAHEALHDATGARALRLQAYLTEPNAQATPQEPPAGSVVHSAMALGRIELLVAAHNSSAALQAMARFDATYAASSLTTDERCRRHFALGLAARKLHRYGEAESNLAFVRARCGHDEDLARRAAFLEARVVNIQDGMRALPLIEQFVASHASHSMADDVLFWAGDSHQRRGHKPEAEAYYERILKLPEPDDQCEEAAWRLAWLAYQDNKLPLARRRLDMLITGRCPKSADGLARAYYWMGRIDESLQQKTQAIKNYRRSMAARPMGYYAQQAAVRVLPLLTPGQRRSQRQDLAVSPSAPPLGLCPLQLVDSAAFVAGVRYLTLGLDDDAATAFRAVPSPLGAHAAGHKMALNRCGEAQAELLLIELRLAAGDFKGGLQALLRHFGHVLLGPNQPGAQEVWRAAYPLAYRQTLAAAEMEQGVPPWLLQALAREESQFDAHVVSWAEAYGLTQLTLGAAQGAGRKLTPKLVPNDKQALFDAQVNARLGGALLGQLGKRYKGFWPLALAAYNGGQRSSDSWWHKYAGEDFARMAEEISIRETRTYVQRVMETFGIYRWLYAEGPVGSVMPARLPKSAGR